MLLQVLKTIRAFLRTAFVPKVGFTDFMEEFLDENYLDPIQDAISDLEDKASKKPKFESQLIKMRKRLDGFVKLKGENWDQHIHRVVVRTLRSTGVPLDGEEVTSNVVFNFITEGAKYIVNKVKPLKGSPSEILKLVRAISRNLVMRDVKEYERQQKIKEREVERIPTKVPQPGEEFEFEELLASIIKNLRLFLTRKGDPKYKQLYPDMFDILVDTAQGGGSFREAFKVVLKRLTPKYQLSKISFYKKWEDFRKKMLGFFRAEEQRTGIPADMVERALKVSAVDRIWIETTRRLIARWVLGESIKDELGGGEYVAPKDMVEDLRNRKKKHKYSHIIESLVQEQCHSTNINVKIANL